MLEKLLENEKDLYAKRLSEGRTDLIATTLLRRIELEIQRLERRIDAKRKNESARKRTRRPLYELKGLMCANWSIVNRYYHTVLRVLTGTKSGEKAGAK